MRRTHITLMPLLGALALSGCGSSTGPNSNGPLSADIDGTHWTAAQATVTSTNNIIAIGAADQTGMGIGIGFLNQGTGNYDIAQNGAINFSVVLGNGQTWSASALQGSGSVNVTTLTAHEVAGTFQFTAPGFTGNPVPTTTKVVTNGQFDISY
jgi:Family of unknown function (DUF6252)